MAGRLADGALSLRASGLLGSGPLQAIKIQVSIRAVFWKLGRKRVYLAVNRCFVSLHANCHLECCEDITRSEVFWALTSQSPIANWFYTAMAKQIGMGQCVMCGRAGKPELMPPLPSSMLLLV